MYQCENTAGTVLTTKIVNTIMSTAIVEVAMDLVCMSKTFKEDEYEETSESFLESINRPNKMKETLENNKAHIISGLKQCRSFMPKGFTPQKTYELLCETMMFVMDYSSISVPTIEMEYIIGVSLQNEAAELQDINEYSYFKDVSCNKNGLVTAVKNFCKTNYLEYTEEEFKETIELLKEIAQANKEMDIENEEKISMSNYQYQLNAFKELISPEDILTFSMYDEDFLMLRDYTVGEIKKSSCNEYLGIVSEEESSILDECSNEER